MCQIIAAPEICPTCFLLHEQLRKICLSDCKESAVVFNGNDAITPLCIEAASALHSTYFEARNCALTFEVLQLQLQQERQEPQEQEEQAAGGAGAAGAAAAAAAAVICLWKQATRHVEPSNAHRWSHRRPFRHLTLRAHSRTSFSVSEFELGGNSNFLGPAPSNHTYVGF